MRGAERMGSGLIIDSYTVHDLQATCNHTAILIMTRLCLLQQKHPMSSEAKVQCRRHREGKRGKRHSRGPPRSTTLQMEHLAYDSYAANNEKSTARRKTNANKWFTLCLGCVCVAYICSSFTQNKPKIRKHSVNEYAEVNATWLMKNRLHSPSDRSRTCFRSCSHLKFELTAIRGNHSRVRLAVEFVVADEQMRNKQANVEHKWSKQEALLCNGHTRGCKIMCR